MNEFSCIAELIMFLQHFIHIIHSKMAKIMMVTKRTPCGGPSFLLCQKKRSKRRPHLQPSRQTKRDSRTPAALSHTKIPFPLYAFREGAGGGFSRGKAFSRQSRIQRSPNSAPFRDTARMCPDMPTTSSWVSIMRTVFMRVSLVLGSSIRAATLGAIHAPPITP